MTVLSTPPTTTAVPSTPTLPEQAPLLLGQIAGYVGHRTIAMGLRTGLIASLADAPGSADDLAERLSYEPFYVGVWCRSALAAGVLERDGDRLRLAPHMATLLLDRASPAYVGGVFLVTEAPEMFTRFERELASGERMRWDKTSPQWIAGVSGTGAPFCTRLVPGGLAQVPGLAERLPPGSAWWTPPAARERVSSAWRSTIRRPP
jgi:hypothetical protein